MNNKVYLLLKYQIFTLLYFALQLLTAQTVTPLMTNATCATPQAGAIAHNITPGTGNCRQYTYLWSTGQTTRDITGLTPIYPQKYTFELTHHFCLSRSITRKKIDYDVLYNAEWILSPGITNVGGRMHTIQSVGTASSRNVLPKDALGYVKFTIDENGGAFCTGRIGFCSMDAYGINTTVIYGFEFQRMGRRFYIVRNGVVDWANPHTYAPNDNFQVVYSNTGIQFLRNGNPVVNRIPNLGTQQTHPPLYVYFNLGQLLMGGSGPLNSALAFKDIATTFGCGDGVGAYAELSKKLNSSCYNMNNSVRFKYREKYNDNVISYVVYDWQRNPVIAYPALGSVPVKQPEQVNHLGVNYHVINAQGFLKSHDVYTMEVRNDKNEVYQMRFRYVFNDTHISIPIGNATVLVSLGRVPINPGTGVTIILPTFALANQLLQNVSVINTSSGFLQQTLQLLKD